MKQEGQTNAGQRAGKGEWDGHVWAKVLSELAERGTTLPPLLSPYT